MMAAGAEELAEIERELLLEAMAKAYGYDFRGYADPSLKRRMNQWLSRSGFGSFGEAQSHLLRDPAVFEDLLRGLTVNVSEMFRDPAVFRTVREEVAPHLKTYPFVKVWHAGCACGEEAYSMAILLQEEGLKHFRIYATDINPAVLKKAQDGMLPLKDMQLFTRNYLESGGKSAFSDYYTARYDHAMLMVSLRDNIVFASHNLAVDGIFGEMQMVFCRNVLIYFKQQLKERALALIDGSLAAGGFLCLSTKESLEGTEIGHRYREIAPGSRIYRKGYL